MSDYGIENDKGHEATCVIEGAEFEVRVKIVADEIYVRAAIPEGMADPEGNLRREMPVITAKRVGYTLSRYIEPAVRIAIEGAFKDYEHPSNKPSDNEAI